MTVPEQAAKYAAVSAIADAILSEKKLAAADLARFATEAGLTKGTLETPLGPVTLRENKGSTLPVVTDEDALVGWCEQNYPDALEHVTRVRAGDREALLTSRFVVVAGEVVDSHTGETLPFASVKVTEPSPPTPSYGNSERQREAKRVAAAITAERINQLAESVTRAAIEGAS